ncbi:MAG: hypothetical protein M0Z30_20825 [Actinomycetota bacterium]|nr:hypothetical protein [Actinomycetota bacterium]
MGPLARLLAGLCGALLAAGAVGIAVHPTGRQVTLPAGSTPHHRAPAAPVNPGPVNPGPVNPGPVNPGPVTTGLPAGAPGPSAAALRAGLITPTDMGSYYRIDAAAASVLLDSAPCLAVLQASPAQSGRALTALLGPGRRSVPTIVEEVASYPGAAARAVFESVVSALDACSSLSFDFGGQVVTASVARSSIRPPRPSWAALHPPSVWPSASWPERRP